jgi:hypothetical protein
VGEGCLADQTFGVVAGGDQQLAGGFGAHAGQRNQAWSGGGDQRAQLGVGFGDLCGEVLPALGQATQRNAKRDLRVGDVGARPGGSKAGDQLGCDSPS